MKKWNCKISTNLPIYVKTNFGPKLSEEKRICLIFVELFLCASMENVSLEY